MHHVGLFSHAAEAHCIQIVHMHGAAPAQHGTPSLATQSMHAVRARPARAKPTRRYRPLLAPCKRAALRAPACAPARRVSRRRRPTVRARAARHARRAHHNPVEPEQADALDARAAPLHQRGRRRAAQRVVHDHRPQQHAAHEEASGEEQVVGQRGARAGRADLLRGRRGQRGRQAARPVILAPRPRGLGPGVTRSRLRMCRKGLDACARRARP